MCGEGSAGCGGARTGLCGCAAGEGGQRGDGGGNLHRDVELLLQLTDFDVQVGLRFETPLLRHGVCRGAPQIVEG